jgi:glycosyltransferase involved in cell wall biosynthesis
LFSQIDGAILDKSMHQQFNFLFPSLPFKLIQLPVFDQFGEPVNLYSARKYLKLPQHQQILLFFGFIRKYKGLDILLEALPEIIRQNPKIHLLVVGECF